MSTESGGYKAVSDDDRDGDDGSAAAPTSSKSPYVSYVSSFLQSYIRRFFNYHLESQWFLQAYDPSALDAYLKQQLSLAAHPRKPPLSGGLWPHWVVVNDVSSKVSTACLTKTLKLGLARAAGSATSQQVAFTALLSQRGPERSQFVVLFPTEEDYDRFLDYVVEESGSVRSNLKAGGSARATVTTADLALRPHGADEKGGEGDLDQVREPWEYRVGGEATKEDMRVASDAGLRAKALESLETMFGRHSEEVRGWRRIVRRRRPP